MSYHSSGNDRKPARHDFTMFCWYIPLFNEALLGVKLIYSDKLHGLETAKREPWTSNECQPTCWKSDKQHKSFWNSNKGSCEIQMHDMGTTPNRASLIFSYTVKQPLGKGSGKAEERRRWIGVIIQSIPQFLILLHLTRPLPRQLLHFNKFQFFLQILIYFT